MGKYLDSKCKLCRRAGEKLMLKGDRCKTPKCAMVKRNYPPGAHGAKGKKRLTDYGTQLIEKQKTRWTYSLMEKQFKLTFDRAKKQKGDAGENLFKFLELRLDNVVFRLGLADSRSQARQIVGHTHITVNSKKVNIPSYVVKEGDIIGIAKTSANNKYFRNVQTKIQNTEIPGWLNLDVKKLEGKVLHAPTAKDVNTNINAHIVVEYYSR